MNNSCKVFILYFASIEIRKEKLIREYNQNFRTLAGNYACNYACVLLVTVFRGLLIRIRKNEVK